MATLTGHVSHYTEEMAAERAARRVKGMHAIAEGIEVRCLGETSDEEIAQTCAQHSQVVRNGPARRRSSDRAKGTGDSDGRRDFGNMSAPTFLQRPDVIDREVNSMSEFKQIFASFRSSWPRDVRSLSNSATQSMSP